MEFTKMQGVGNDYIVLDGFMQPLCFNRSQIAIALSDRNFGIGSDGILLLEPAKSPSCDCYMEMYNSDGSFSPVCGNGIRMAAHYLYEMKYTLRHDPMIETSCGEYQMLIHELSNNTADITVCMGRPNNNRDDCLLSCNDQYEILIPIKKHQALFQKFFSAFSIKQNTDGSFLQASYVNMGNPHCIVFLKRSPFQMDLDSVGAYLEHHNAFPNRTNVEFVYAVSDHCFEMRVWERGSKETASCGSGSCAVYEAASARKMCRGNVQIMTKGGSLHIHKQSDHGSIYLRGKTSIVFQGKIEPYIV